MNFEGKSILITGAAGDIGFAVAERFAEKGATPILTDMDADKLSKRKEQLGQRGESVYTYVADVTKLQSLKGMVEQIEADGLRIDMLFNNAGYQGLFKKTFEYPEDDFAKVININLIGAFNVLRVVSEHMVKHGGGAIVNTASMAGVDGPPNMIAYGASKFGIIGITQSAAKDLAPYNIRVNAISPAFMGPGFMWERQVQLQAEADSQYFDSDPNVVAQQMIGAVPMRRYGNITEIPGTVVYLMSEDSSYVTGVNIPISGGIR
jgi:NAD(P)-dependent dehydrogenase (short-subunit alcohol dehydrogenase family)